MGQKEAKKHFKRDNFENAEEEEWDLGEEVEIPKRDYAWPALDDIKVFRKLPRPRLGSRHWVRTNTRRYIKATFNDVVDFRDCTAVNAGRLLCMSLAYTEEGVTEWLQPMFASLCKFYSGRSWAASDSLAMQTYSTVCKLLGCYLDPNSYWEQLKSSLDMDTTQTLDARIANLKILALCLEGSVETLKSVSPPDPTLGLGRLEKVIPELISAMHASDLLVAPSDNARKAMWALLFTFLEPLQEQLSFSQVSELLFVSLALTAKDLPEDTAELAGNAVLADATEAVEFEEEELVDPENLDRALTTLSKIAGTTGAEESQFSLDDLDDFPAPPVSVDSDPRVVHRRLFELAFAEILNNLDADSFHVFRSVIYLSPVTVLTSSKHSGAILERLASFSSLSASPAVRSSSLALGIHLALRCAKLIRSTPSGTWTHDAHDFMWRVFRAQGEVLIKSIKQINDISYSVMMSGMLLWRRFFTCPDVRPRDALFNPDDRQPSRPLEWLVALLGDQELNKRFHHAMQHAESSHSGLKKEDFVIAKAKSIREESEHRSSVARALAASTLLVAVRKLLEDDEAIPWPDSSQAGSPRQIFLGVSSLFRVAAHKIEPPWVRPTQPQLTLYAAELMHLLHHTASSSEVPPFRLRDDAAKAITQLQAPASKPDCGFELTAEEQDALAGDFITTLIDLNLNLPPDPSAKHAPTTLSDATDDKILLGCIEDKDDLAVSSASRKTAAGRNAVVPREVTRILSQTEDCLRWNCALALYSLGMDLAQVCKDGFTRSLMKNRRRGEQAKILVCTDLLARAQRQRDLQVSGTPAALGPPQ